MDTFVKRLVSNYKSTKRRLIILDHDGVLVPRRTSSAVTTPSDEVKKLIGEFASDDKNTMVVMSDHGIDYLNRHWFDTNVVLVAENGALHRIPGKSWQSLFSCDSSWITTIAPVIEMLAVQYEGTSVERKDTSVAWRYGDAGAKIYYPQLQQVSVMLRTLANSKDVAMYHGEGCLELYTRAIDAGSFISRWIAGSQYDFIMSIADTRVDETMFGQLVNDAFLIRVSRGGFTHSDYLLDNQKSVLPFLAYLLSMSGNSDD